MIVEAVDAFYAKQAEAPREPHRFRPSNIGDCLRKHALLLSGIEREPLSGETQRVFEHGHQRGARLEEIARKIWPDAETQVPVSIPVPWGTMEGTVDLWIPSLLTVVDWKTVSVFGFANLDVEGVSEDYQFQIHAYRHGIVERAESFGNAIVQAFREDEPAPIKLDKAKYRAVLVYESKDSDARKGVKAGALKEREVPFTVDLEARYQARLEALHGLRRQDPFSVPGLPSTHWKCRMKEGRPVYCPIGSIRGRCHE